MAQACANTAERLAHRILALSPNPTTAARGRIYTPTGVVAEIIKEEAQHLTVIEACELVRNTHGLLPVDIYDDMPRTIRWKIKFAVRCTRAEPQALPPYCPAVEDKRPLRFLGNTVYESTDVVGGMNHNRSLWGQGMRPIYR